MKATSHLLILTSLVLANAETQCRVACDRAPLIWAKDSKSDVALFRVVRDGKAGYIDAGGRLVIRHQFDLGSNSGGDFTEGLGAVQANKLWGFIDSMGEFVIPAKFEWVTPFSEGRALVRLGGGGPPYKIGFIDKQGQFVGEPSLNGAAGPFSEGYAPVELPNERWTYMDLLGKISMPRRFAWARPFSEGLARVIEKGGCEVLEDLCDCRDFPADPTDRKPGNLKAPFPACRFSYIDQTGKTMLMGYQNGKEFSEGLAAVRTERLWGFIHKDGSIAIPEQFEGAKPFREGLAAVRLGGKWGFINSTGKMVIQPRFDNTEGFSEGVGLVWLDRHFAYINKSGEVIFGRTFSAATPFVKGLAHVALEEPRSRQWAYIDHRGTVVYRYSARQ